MAGYVKLYRQLESWEWYTDVNTTKLFIHCLLMANHKVKRWRGVDIQAGSFISSYGKLAKQSGLSVQQVRTSMNRLKSTHELTQESTSEFSVITIVKWLDYQGSDDVANTEINTPSNNQSTSDQQASNKQSTTNNNDKNDKNTNKDKDCIKKGVFETFAGDDEELKNSLKEFNQMRIKIGKPMTDKAKGMICTKLLDLQSKGDNMNDCINQSILNCWTGVFPIMEEKNFQKKQKKVPSFLDMLKEEENEPK